MKTRFLALFKAFLLGFYFLFLVYSLMSASIGTIVTGGDFRMTIPIVSYILIECMLHVIFNKTILEEVLGEL